MYSSSFIYYIGSQQDPEFFAENLLAQPQEGAPTVLHLS